MKFKLCYSSRKAFLCITFSTVYSLQLLDIMMARNLSWFSSPSQIHFHIRGYSFLRQSGYSSSTSVLNYLSKGLKGMDIMIFIITIKNSPDRQTDPEPDPPFFTSHAIKATFDYLTSCHPGDKSIVSVLCTSKVFVFILFLLETMQS